MVTSVKTAPGTRCGLLLSERAICLVHPWVARVRTWRFASPTLKSLLLLGYVKTAELEELVGREEALPLGVIREVTAYKTGPTTDVSATLRAKSGAREDVNTSAR